jgi:hypothetical protein
MDLVVGDALTGNILINGTALVLVVAQRIEYLCEGQMGEANKNLFGCDAKLPQLCNGSHRCASSRHNGCAVENVVRGDDIGMARCSGHDASLLEGLQEVNLTPI